MINKNDLEITIKMNPSSVSESDASQLLSHIQKCVEDKAPRISIPLDSIILKTNWVRR